MIKTLFAEEGKLLGSLTCVFCTDEYLLDINRRFLSHNYYTDIITFNLSESAAIIGEIYISINRVKENAADFGSSFPTELCRVIFHGCLHLCGYDDRTVAQKNTIRKKEDHYLALFERG